MCTNGLIFILIIFSTGSLLGQSMSYTPFKGKVYKYPNKRTYIPFEEDYADLYPLINEISWDSIHVTQRETEEGFPDVDRDGAFGIMFSTVLTIEETAMYRFAVTSDDGSIVWVNGDKIIDNDFSNGMHMKDDTIALRPGNHSVKIWYYQAYPTMFGIVYESEPLDCEVKFDVDTVSINQDLLFKFGQSRLIAGSETVLDSVGKVLLTYEQVKINIIGFTDNVGSYEPNRILSQRRADAIRDYLLSHVVHNGAVYITRGRGELDPIANNNTPEGRAKNRRVEILIEGY